MHCVWLEMLFGEGDVVNGRSDLASEAVDGSGPALSFFRSNFFFSGSIILLRQRRLLAFYTKICDLVNQ